MEYQNVFKIIDKKRLQVRALISDNGALGIDCEKYDLIVLVNSNSRDKKILKEVVMEFIIRIINLLIYIIFCDQFEEEELIVSM